MYRPSLSNYIGSDERCYWLCRVWAIDCVWCTKNRFSLICVHQSEMSDLVTRIGTGTECAMPSRVSIRTSFARVPPLASDSGAMRSLHVLCMNNRYGARCHIPERVLYPSVCLSVCLSQPRCMPYWRLSIWRRSPNRPMYWQC